MKSKNIQYLLICFIGLWTFISAYCIYRYNFVVELQTPYIDITSLKNLDIIDKKIEEVNIRIEEINERSSILNEREKKLEELKTKEKIAQEKKDKLVIGIAIGLGLFFGGGWVINKIMKWFD